MGPPPSYMRSVDQNVMQRMTVVWEVFMYSFLNCGLSLHLADQ